MNDRRISQNAERIKELERQLEAAGESWRDLVTLLLEMNERREKRYAEMVKLLTHTVIVVAMLASYVVLTIHGDDATYLLTALVAYIGGAGVEKATNARRGT